MAKAKLDFDHGFIRSVIKNQLDRHNYENEVKASKNKPKLRPSRCKAKKPDLTTYVPPKDRSSNADYLFTFEYKDEHGEVIAIEIYKDSNAEEIAERLRNQKNYTKAMGMALENFLRREIDKRIRTAC